jgi:hypothetical protein
MLVNFCKNKRCLNFLYHVHRWAVTQVSNVPIKYDSHTVHVGDGPVVGRLSLIRSHQISWQVWDNLAVVCSIWWFRSCHRWMDGWCHKLCDDSEVATDGRMVSQTLRPTPTPMIVLGTCNIGPFFCFPRGSWQATMQLTPQSGSSVIFSVKEPLWMSPSKSDVSIFQHHNNFFIWQNVRMTRNFFVIISHGPPLTR